MPHVAADGSPLHERLIYLKYGTTYLPALCDADGNIIAVLGAGQVIEVEQATAADLNATVVVAAGQSIAVTQATAASLKALCDINDNQNIQARHYGFFGADWRKAPLAFGPSAAVSEMVSNTALLAGTNTLDFTAVPASTLYVITNLAMQYVGTVPGTISYYILGQTGTPLLYRQLAPATSAVYDRQGWWVLEAADYLRITVTGATAGDDLYGYCQGFSISVA